MIEPKVFYGTVTSIMDPEERGRIQVRIPEIHAISIPEEDLPWCYVMLGTPGSTVGEGTSPTGFRPGDNVAGFFRDQSMQLPVVCWTWAGEGDISPLVHGKDNDTTLLRADQQTVVSESNVEFEEPITNYADTKYPYNVVQVSRSGHVVEIDDTDGHQRMAWIHRLGSYFEWKPDGTAVDKTVGDRFEITDGNKREFIGGNQRAHHRGAATSKYGATLYIKSAGLQSYVSSGDMLFKSGGVVELRAEILNVIADLAVSESITVPLVKARDVICDNLQCSGIINGTAKYALQAGKASGLGPTSPAKGASPGDTNTYPRIKDNDGYQD